MYSYIHIISGVPMCITAITTAIGRENLHDSATPR